MFKPGQHAINRLAGSLLDPVDPLFEQSDISPETVDDKATDPFLLLGRDAGQGADDLGENAATIVV